MVRIKQKKQKFFGVHSIVSALKISDNKIGNITIHKVKIKHLCGIFVVLFTLKLRNFILKEVHQVLLNLIIRLSGVDIKSAIKHTTKILCVYFLTGAMQITDQHKCCVNLRFNVLKSSICLAACCVLSSGLNIPNCFSHISFSTIVNTVAYFTSRV